MANDDAGDKTEQPTARRREEAREQGQIARSVDLVAAIAMLAGLMLLRVVGPGMIESMLGMTRALGEVPDVTAGGLIEWTRRVGLATANLILPFVGLLVVITVAGAATQSGLRLTWKKLEPKADRLHPVQGFKRMFSSDALNRLVQGLLKVAVVAGIAYLTIAAQLPAILDTGTLHVGGVFARSGELIFTLAMRMGVALLILGVFDYFFQRWKLEQQLRMTKQEVRDELKRMEGDPLIKQRRRRMQARLAMQRLRTEVPRADVVVTNPTHYAVALRYDERTMPAPRVLAKGKDYLAQRIREIALLHGVPVVQRAPLARALYVGVEVGEEVPPQFYRAVAELLAYVYRMSGKAVG